MNAVVFFYREVLSRDMGLIENVVRAKRPPKLPVVLSVSEVKRVFKRKNGTVAKDSHRPRDPSNAFKTSGGSGASNASPKLVHSRRS
ncbi:MAG: hypothetical protein ABIO65_05625 [Nitrospiria bacterium]